MTGFLDTQAYRIQPDTQVDLGRFDPRDDGHVDKDNAPAYQQLLRDRLIALQELLYAQGKHSLLVVFQAMDAGGKDSTIRHVIGPLNPAGVRVTSFKAPNTIERGHDFLWRIHQHTPRRGYISVFNRSHYEEVLIARVHELVPEKTWQARYAHINAFESLLADEGTQIVKFYLHISKAYQKERLQRRLDQPDKNWKFEPADLKERAHWDDYRHAFEAALSKCSTRQAPWYVVPAQRRWFRDLLVSQVLVEHLEALKMTPPKPTFDPAHFVIE